MRRAGRFPALLPSLKHAILYSVNRTAMSHDQELRAIFQIHSIPEQAQKELRELFKKSNRDGFQEGWREGHEDGFYEATDE